jgi:FkbM family methyltransferase
MDLLTSIVRFLIPKPIRRRVREAKIEREARRWRDLGLSRELAGLTVRVASKSDWVVFNEIFVERFYDRAISYVLDGAVDNSVIRVLDLGANVGYFALRFAQMVFESRRPALPFMIHCVEGSPKVYEELCARLTDNSLLRGHIKLTQGLVGERSGSAKMYESPFGAGNSVIHQHWSKPVETSFVDLNKLIPDSWPISLVKCDIEGSEQDFQHNYSELLSRTQAAVVELHHEYIDPDKFHDGMTELGFMRREELWQSQRERASLVLYLRAPLDRSGRGAPLE